MPSYTIPEEVIGVPLFVPEDYDFFEIVEGGMPNGDNCLRVRGDINSNYKAFQPAPITTPLISGDGTAWSLNLWIKAPASGGTGDSGVYLSCILSMMRAVNASSGISTNALWSLRAGTTSGQIHFFRGVSAGGGNFIFAVTAAGVRDDTWHMITVMTPTSAGTGYIYKDQDASSLASDTQPLPTTAGHMQNMFLCIGKYSNLAGTGFAADYQIGKISFHDHQLTLAERQSLYTGMQSSTAVGCTINVAPGQADPATGGTVTFRVVFSESVSGFISSDVVISGTAGATTAIVTGGVDTYDVSVSGMTTPGTVIINIPAGSVVGENGGTNVASVAIDNSIAWS